MNKDEDDGEDANRRGWARGCGICIGWDEGMGGSEGGGGGETVGELGVERGEGL